MAYGNEDAFDNSHEAIRRSKSDSHTNTDTSHFTKTAYMNNPMNDLIMSPQVGGTGGGGFGEPAREAGESVAKAIEGRGGVVKALGKAGSGSGAGDYVKEKAQDLSEKLSRR